MTSTLRKVSDSTKKLGKEFALLLNRCLLSSCALCHSVEYSTKYHVDEVDEFESICAAASQVPHAQQNADIVSAII